MHRLLSINCFLTLFIHSVCVCVCLWEKEREQHTLVQYITCTWMCDAAEWVYIYTISAIHCLRTWKNTEVSKIYCVIWFTVCVYLHMYCVVVSLSLPMCVYVVHVQSVSDGASSTKYSHLDLTGWTCSPKKTYEERPTSPLFWSSLTVCPSYEPARPLNQWNGYIFTLL